MEICRIVKRFKNLDVGEEREMGHALNDAPRALEIITQYLMLQLDKFDKELNNTTTLYQGQGDRNVYVATLLAQKEAHIKLLKLLNEKVTLDVDQTKD